jgi:hypothetical protein
MSPEQIRQLARQEWEAAQQQSARDAAVKTWKRVRNGESGVPEEPGFRQRLAGRALRSPCTTSRARCRRRKTSSAPTTPPARRIRASKIVQSAQGSRSGEGEARRVSTPAAAAGVKNEPAGPGGGGKAKNTEEEVARQYDRLTRPARV